MKRILVFLLAMVAFASAKADLYPETFVVTRIDQENDIVHVETFSENEFSFYGIEDYMIGDGVAAIMNDNNTQTIYDDEIVCVQYCGAIKFERWW